MIHPGIEAQTESLKLRESSAELPSPSNLEGASLRNAPLPSQVVEWRIPRKRLGLAAACASSTGATSSPNDRSANPTMAAATCVLTAESEAARRAILSRNSVSPIGLIFSGPFLR